jgi:hypothetical protein
MINMQAVVDALGQAGRNTRSNYHLTLGAAITALEALDDGAWITFDTSESPGELRSYRGYYSDLAFEPADSPATVGTVLASLRAALGATFEGYKGGDFIMDKETPLWVSHWGSCSDRALIGVAAVGGSVVFVTKLVRDE